jgi:hypothetical protein
MSIRLELEPGQAWDLRRVLEGLCECAGRRLPDGLERTALYSLLDRFDEAMDKATPMTTTAATGAAQPSAVSWVEGYRALVDAGLHGQAASALARYGLRPQDLPRMTDAELLSFRNVGKRALERIRAVFPFAVEEVSPPVAGHAGSPVVEPHEPLIVDGEVVD